MSERTEFINKPVPEDKITYTFIEEYRCEDCNFPITRYYEDSPSNRIISANLCLCEFDPKKHIWQDHWPWFNVKDFEPEKEDK